MFRLSTADEYEANSTEGTRHLFALDNFQFRDTLDDAGRLHPYIVEAAGGEDALYEVDAGSMYELMARYLAGVYEIVEYDLETSPAHDALLDLLEFATARARTGDGDFTLHDVEAEDSAGDEEEPEEEGEESEAWRG